MFRTSIIYVQMTSLHNDDEVESVSKVFKIENRFHVTACILSPETLFAKEIRL